MSQFEVRATVAVAQAGDVIDGNDTGAGAKRAPRGPRGWRRVGVAHAYACTRDPRMSGSSATATDARLTRETWHRLVETIVAFATSHVRFRAAALFAGLLGLLFAISGLNVVNSYVGRDFMTAIEHRDQSAFVHRPSCTCWCSPP